MSEDRRAERLTQVQIRPDTKQRLRAARDGAGITYDELLNILLDTFKMEGEDDLLAGYRIRKGREEETPGNQTGHPSYLGSPSALSIAPAN